LRALILPGPTAREERKRNAFAKVCFYIAANPVRGKLAAKSEQWPFIGCVNSRHPKLRPLEEGFWLKFWEIYGAMRQPDSGNITRPQF